MKKILFTGLFVVLFAAGIAQKPYKIVFYNFENLFDTVRDPDIFDEEFTPGGLKNWNSAKYNKKIGNLERVLFDIAAADRLVDGGEGLPVGEAAHLALAQLDADVLADLRSQFRVGVAGKNLDIFTS